MIAGFFGTIYTLWMYTGWLPYYLEHERHMSIARVGIVAAIPYFFGCVGAVVGGWLCDVLTRRGWAPIAGRKLLISSALIGIAACTLGTVLAQSNAIVARPHFRFTIPYLHREQRRVGYRPDRCSQPVHRILGLHSEFRRLSGWRAGSDGNGIHRATHRQLLASIST